LRSLIKWGVIVSLVAGVVIQFIPVVPDVEERNPEERFTPKAPPEVLAILKRACFDCHSNETVWPLYAELAPGRWLMHRDVRKGRNSMNFSEWGDYDAEEREYDKEESWEQIESGEMPPWFYVYPLHMDAKLSEADKALLKEWMLAPESDPEQAEAEADEGQDASDEKTTDDDTDDSQ